MAIVHRHLKNNAATSCEHRSIHFQIPAGQRKEKKAESDITFAKLVVRWLGSRLSAALSKTPLMLTYPLGSYIPAAEAGAADSQQLLHSFQLSKACDGLCVFTKQTQSGH